MSINAKLIASGVILAAIASTFSFQMYRGAGVLGQTVQSVFDTGVDPLRDVDAAVARVQRLQDRIVDTQDAGGPLAIDGDMQARVLDDLSAALAALRKAGTRIGEPSLTQRLQELDFAISRLRATEGDVTRRFLRRELSETLSGLEDVTQKLQHGIQRLRDDTSTQSRQLADMNWLALAVLLAAGGLLIVYLGWSISGPIRRAASTLRDVGGDEPQPKRRSRNALQDLSNAVAFVEALVVQRADAAQQRDTDQKERAEHEIAAQRRRFDAALDRMSQAYCLLDRDGDLQSANEAFYRLFPHVTRRATAALLAADPDLGPLLTEPASRETPRRLAGGRSVFLLRHRAARTGDEILVFEDVTDREAAREAIERLEGEDGLTSLPNRPAFIARVEQLIASGDRFTLVALDIEGFRNINTTLGHGAGDEVLRQVGRRIVAAAGPDAFVARLGADEFGIALARQTDAAAAERLMRSILSDLQDKPVVVAGRPLTARIAAGVVPVAAEADRTEALDAHGAMQDCEVALHRAKADGSAQLQVFAPELRAEMEARRRLVADLHDALARNEFELYFQPIVDCRRKTVSGFEALARWAHPQRGMVSPAEFIPVMEEAGIIGALGRFVLREGCRQAARWPSDLSISLNLSPLQFKSPTLLADVRNALSSSGLSPDRLHLEVTESLFLDDAEGVLQTLQSLRQMGLVVSMDDFGTGYSSLGYLSRFPFDKIKIDQSFVRDMARPENIAIVRAVMGLGSAMRMTVVAEGVETVEQMEQLEREGCREMQGYLFSRPRPAGDLPKMLMEIRSRFRANGYGVVRADNDAIRA
nr:bifunctional diguanylate cyclase/phosphodiesterase [Aureimonas jatrophae]